jgi:hypothetical protein
MLSWTSDIRPSAWKTGEQLLGREAVGVRLGLPHGHHVQATAGPRDTPDKPANP